jgi:hypothetical protein
MVSAPRNGQHLQQAQDAGANVEDVFHGSVSIDEINMRPTYGKNKECN